jgi:hypothetical protein
MTMTSTASLRGPSFFNRISTWWRNALDDSRLPSDAWEEAWDAAIGSACVAIRDGSDLIEFIDLVGHSDLPLVGGRLLRLIGIAESAAAKYDMHASIRSMGKSSAVRVSTFAGRELDRPD